MHLLLHVDAVLASIRSFHYQKSRQKYPSEVETTMATSRIFILINEFHPTANLYIENSNTIDKYLLLLFHNLYTLIIQLNVNVFSFLAGSVVSFVLVVSILGTEKIKQIDVSSPQIPMERKGNVKPPKLNKPDPIAGPRNVNRLSHTLIQMSN